MRLYSLAVAGARLNCAKMELMMSALHGKASYACLTARDYATE